MVVKGLLVIINIQLGMFRQLAGLSRVLVVVKGLLVVVEGLLGMLW